MEFNVRFLCFDERPLHKEKGLVNFLEPLHRENNGVMNFTGKDENLRRTYYRGIGSLDTKKKKKAEVNPAYFRTRNSIRLPEFVFHKIDFKSKEYDLVRENRFLRRYFTSRNYGIINRLEYDFKFAIKSKEGNGNGNGSVKGDTVFKFLKFIFEMNVNTGDRKAGNLQSYEFWELGEDWFRSIVADSTRCKPFSKGDIDKKEIVSCAPTAVVVYDEGDLAELPEHIRDFKVKDHIHNVDIWWYNYKSKGVYDIRVYFICVKKDKPSQDFLRGLVSALFELRESYAWLDEALCNREGKEKGSVDKSFTDNYLESIIKIRDSENYGFLYPHEENSDKIYDHKKREEISRHLRDYGIEI